MYTVKRISVFELIVRGWKKNLLLVVATTAITFVYIEFRPEKAVAAPSVFTGFVTAIAFFVAFFSTQAYGRWWEARKIWGTYVNDSRSFARMVLAFFPMSDGEPDITALRTRLVHRHIAHLYALKERLREESTHEYLKYLSDEDGRQVSDLSSVANAILGLQGKDIVAAEREGHIDGFKQAQLNDMLSRFSTSMGMAERIKTTVFPAYYSALIRVAVWVLIFTYPISLSGQIGYWAILFASLFSMILLMIFEVGQAMMTPFEGKPSDTPMSSIVRNIEINLLEELGESDIPAPVEAVDGRYLM